MSCQTNTIGRQTEFDFFQQIRMSPNYCGGPMTEIGFTGPSIKSLQAAIVASKAPDDFLDRYNLTVLNSNISSYEMCAHHWFSLAKIIGWQAAQENNEEWHQLAYFIFKVTCLTNEWDYKEILNYSK